MRPSCLTALLVSSSAACPSTSPPAYGPSPSGDAQDEAADAGGAEGALIADASGSPEAAVKETPPETAAPACNPIKQDCPGGENCTFPQGSDNQACAAAGTVPYGGDCSKDDCERGICLDINDTGQKCYQFCKTSAHCQDQSECIKLSEAVYLVCDGPLEYESCELLANACPDGKACYASGEATPVCLPEGAGTAGAGCDSVNDCAGGFTCVNKKCYALCDKQKGVEACPNFVPCANHWDNVGYCDG